MWIKFFGWLTTLSLNWWQALIFLIVVMVGILLLNFPKTKPIWVWLVTRKKKRVKIPCASCIQITFSKREKMETKREIIENKILKDQMNFVETKLSELNTLCINNYSKLLSDFRVDDSDEPGNEIIQSRLYWGVLFEALEKLVKDELRRSFKENGFYEVGGVEFQQFVKNRSMNIVSILTYHIRNAYPPKGLGMIIDQEYILNFLENISSKIEDIAFDIYIEAKRIKKVALDEINKIETSFYKEMDEYEKELSL